MRTMNGDPWPSMLSPHVLLRSVDLYAIPHASIRKIDAADLALERQVLTQMTALSRFFNEKNDLSHRRVAVIDLTMARRSFPGENPVGQQHLLIDAYDPGHPVEMIGCRRGERRAIGREGGRRAASINPVEALRAD